MSIQRFLGGRLQLWGATFVSEGALLSLLASIMVVQRHMQPSRHLGYDNCLGDESTRPGREGGVGCFRLPEKLPGGRPVTSKGHFY